MADKEKNIHKGHRERLRRKYINADTDKLDNFPPHEILELLLFYTIPRANTNELAHRLINTFGSIHAVFDADVFELEQVDGIGHQSAVFLNIISAAFRVYANSKHDLVNVIVNSRNIGSYVRSLFYAREYEALFMLSLDSKNRVLSTDMIAHGAAETVNVNLRKIVSAALRSNAVGVILVHNHPGGSAIPSEADRRTTTVIKNILIAIHIKLIDHIIVSDDEFVSMNFDLNII